MAPRGCAALGSVALAALVLLATPAASAPRSAPNTSVSPDSRAEVLNRSAERIQGLLAPVRRLESRSPAFPLAAVLTALVAVAAAMLIAVPAFRRRSLVAVARRWRRRAPPSLPRLAA